MILRTNFTSVLKLLALFAISLLLLAFDEAPDFTKELNFPELVSQFESLPASIHYRDQWGIEIEGFYTEKRILGHTKVTRSHEPFSDSSLLNYTVNGVEQNLAFANDPSIFRPEGKIPVEIVSPIIGTQSQYDTFLKILVRATREISFQSEPLHSGTHLHFDFNNPNPAEILILTIILEKLFPEIKELFNIQNLRPSVHAKPYTVADFKALVNFLSNVNKGEYDANNPQLLKIQVDLIRKIVRAVRLRDPGLIALLKIDNGKHISLKTVAKTLNARIFDADTAVLVKKQSTFEVDRSLAIKNDLREVPGENFQRLLTPFFPPLLVPRISSRTGLSSHQDNYNYSYSWTVPAPRGGKPACLKFYR